MDYTSISFPHVCVCPAIVCVSRYFHLFLLRFPKTRTFPALSVMSSATLLFSFSGDDGMLFDRTENLSSKKKRKEEEEMSQISLSHKLIFLKRNFHPRPLMDFLRPTPPLKKPSV